MYREGYELALLKASQALEAAAERFALRIRTRKLEAKRRRDEWGGPTK